MRVLRDTQQFAHRPLVVPVQRRHHCPEAQRAGGKHQVLDRGIDARTAGDPGIDGKQEAAGDDDRRGFVQVVCKILAGRRGARLGGSLFRSHLHPRRSAIGGQVLRPLGRIDLLEALLFCRISDHQEAPGLYVATVRRTSGGPEHLLDQFDRHRVRLQAAHRPLRTDHLEDVCFYDTVVHRHMRLTEDDFRQSYAT